MVVSIVRDYLRKMSEATDKAPPPRESVRMPSPGIRDGSTVSALAEYGITLMVVLPRSGYLIPQWVNYIGHHNSKRHMNQGRYPESVELSTKLYKRCNYRG
jgi:hypothetical protein